MADDSDDLQEKRLCCQCIGEPFLSGVVMRTGEVQHCAYCESTDKTLSIGDVAAMVEVAFEQHFVRTSSEPHSWQITMLSDRESNYSWEREGEPVIDAIANAAEIPREAAEDIQQVLADEHGDFDKAAAGIEDEFDSDACYRERDVNTGGWTAEWEAFERSLKTEARFFSQTAAAHLEAIFNGLDELATRDGRPLIAVAGPSETLKSLFRARVFQAEDQLLDALMRPDAHLGSPPARLAAAGRMNPRGISVFYGAGDAHTAIAEVRPPVGSRVAVAQFDIIRPLRLLDLTALSDVRIEGSVFDPDFAGLLERTSFLRTLSRRITRPVMPDDEALEYLATQAIADFLATDGRRLDGIIFRSVQAAGDVRNVVLFHKAARVEAVSLPKGASIFARSGDWYEEGFEIDYQVQVEIPRTGADGKTPDPDALGPQATFELWTDSHADRRDPAVRICLDTITVHEVNRVRFETAAHRVRRSTHEKWPPVEGYEPF